MTFKEGGAARLDRLDAVFVSDMPADDRRVLFCHVLGGLSNYVTDEEWDRCIESARAFVAEVGA